MKNKNSIRRLKRTTSTVTKITVAVFALLTSIITPAQAAGNGINLDFAASYYLSYNHSVGGGAWDDRTVNTDIENSLEGSEFACNDLVSFLTKIEIEDTSDMRANGKMTLAIDYLFDGDTTGQSGVAYTQFGTVSINRSPVTDLVAGEDNVDSAHVELAGSLSQATLTNVQLPTPPFTPNEALTGTVLVDDLEAGETIILRTDVRISCDPGSTPTGNILARLKNTKIIKINGDSLLDPPTQIGAGEQTVPLQRPGGIAQPSLVISKSAYKGSVGTCPGVDYNVIKVNGSVTYCYVVTNNSDVTSPPGAPIYNVSSISDDNGTPSDISDDFLVALAGLTDQDADGTLDDLAAGASVTVSKFRQFNGEKNTTIINTAVVSGFTAPTGGTQLTASDTTEVFIDPPVVAIVIDKKTNGGDGLYILASDGVNFTYDVTNTGDVALSSINVDDSDTALVITCPKTTLEPAETMQCTATGTWQAGDYSNTATASGINGTDTATDSDASSYFGADPKISIAKTPDTQTVVEGTTANFSIVVTNNGNVALTRVAVVDALVPGCDKTIGAMAVAGTDSYTCSLANVTSGFTNTAIASGNYETTTVSASDTATVVVDYLPKINVTKTPSTTSVPETGADVTFTFVVTNEAVEAFTLKSLLDDMLGDLNGQGCTVPQIIAAGGNYTCAVTKNLASDSLTPHVNIVTASGEDPEGNTTSDTATATVNFTDVLPDITLTKTANPTVLMLPGGPVDYTLKITNSGTETVIVGSLSDPQLTLSAQCLALVGQLIAPSAFLTCLIEGVNVTSTTGLPFTNTATATAYDNESNYDTATATATVTFDWYGRSPGYWKNHPNQWPSSYAPSNTIVSVFFPTGDLPTFLKTGGILNLNSTNGTDTLAEGLAYKGGSEIKGAAQILLRAAVAALLNEKYYGPDYPGSDSVTNLIQMVHDTLLTGDRSAYLALASTLDKWNNGIHSSM